jgi:hypothetical protein
MAAAMRGCPPRCCVLPFHIKTMTMTRGCPPHCHILLSTPQRRQRGAVPLIAVCLLATTQQRRRLTDKGLSPSSPYVSFHTTMTTMRGCPPHCCLSPSHNTAAVRGCSPCPPCHHVFPFIPHHNDDNEGLSPSLPLACWHVELVVDLVY